MKANRAATRAGRTAWFQDITQNLAGTPCGCPASNAQESEQARGLPARNWAGTRPAPTTGLGSHKGCPYGAVRWPRVATVSGELEASRLTAEAESRAVALARTVGREKHGEVSRASAPGLPDEASETRSGRPADAAASRRPPEPLLRHSTPIRSQYKQTPTTKKAYPRRVKRRKKGSAARPPDWFT